ncbi:hypothetical protein ACUY2L_04045 [Corynebacterium mastitidis]
MVVVLALVGLPVGLGVAAAVTTTSGRMVVDQQTMDLFHAHVDEQVLGYYDAVCSEIVGVQETSRAFTLTAQDVIGLAPQDATAMWKERLVVAADDLDEITRRVQEIEAHAPAKVLRPDDEDADYRGALIPLERVVATGAGKVRGAVDDPRWDAVDAQGAQQEAATEAMGAVAGIPGEVSGVLEQVVEHARVFSEATKQAVEQRSSCRALFEASNIAQDAVLDEVVEAYQQIRGAHERFAEVMEAVAGLEGLTGEDLGAAQAEIARAWAQVASVAEGNQADLARWSNQQKMDSAEWEAVEKVRPFVDEAAAAYEAVHRWALDQEAATWAAPLSVEGLQTVLNSSVEGLREQQIGEAKAVTKALTMMPVPNEATAKEIQQDKGEDQ